MPVNAQQLCNCSIACNKLKEESLGYTDNPPGLFYPANSNLNLKNGEWHTGKEHLNPLQDLPEPLCNWRVFILTGYIVRIPEIDGVDPKHVIPDRPYMSSGLGKTTAPQGGV